MNTLTLCGCEPTPTDVDGVITRCSRDGASEHVLTEHGLAVTDLPTDTIEEAKAS